MWYAILADGTEHATYVSDIDDVQTATEDAESWIKDAGIENVRYELVWREESDDE